MKNMSFDSLLVGDYCQGKVDRINRLLKEQYGVEGQ